MKGCLVIGTNGFPPLLLLKVCPHATNRKLQSIAAIKGVVLPVPGKLGGWGLDWPSQVPMDEVQGFSLSCMMGTHCSEARKEAAHLLVGGGREMSMSSKAPEPAWPSAGLGLL